MSDMDTPGVNPEIQTADGDCAQNEKIRGNVWVHDRIEVVQKESAMVGMPSRNCFESPEPYHSTLFHTDTLDGTQMPSEPFL
jgi:hypothetical protein